MNVPHKNYYQYLGLEVDASIIEVEAAYRRLVQDGDPPGDLDLPGIKRAFEVLRDPQRRQLYDSLLAEIAAPPLISSVQISSPTLPLLDDPQTVYCLMEIKSPDQDDADLQPLNLCLVIDRSTSMQGERLMRVKNALALLLEKLSPGDFLSLISFSDRAEVLLAANQVGEHKNPLKLIKSIEASGGTEIYQGMLAGWQQLQQAGLDKHNNQLILLTDGQTYGDAHLCFDLANKAPDDNITLNAFGIGTDWDDQFLDGLVSPSGGMVEFIDNPEVITAALEKRVKGMGTTFGRNLTLRARWPGRVTLADCFKLTPFAKPLEIAEGEILLGHVEGQTPLTFLLEFTISPRPIPARIRMPLIFQADIPGQGEQVFREVVNLELVKGGQRIPPPQDIVRAVRLLTMNRLSEKAWQEAESGALAAAAKHMNYLSTRLLESGNLNLARQASSEGQRLAREKGLSPEGRMRLKYGTRSLMSKSLPLELDDKL